MRAARRWRIALVGVGKIARDQHGPALRDSADFDLVATADPQGGIEGVSSYPSIDALLSDGLALDAISICMPPSGRSEVAHRALDAGLHVMLEKPPAATLAAVEALRTHAAQAGVSLFATWHSREAGGVAPARAWLTGKRIDRVTITWAENIRQWHPGQDWILEAGGFGVFDPGINALSIATAILPQQLVLGGAALSVPANRQSPIAATLTMRCGAAPVTATFDFLREGQQRWDIEIEVEGERLALREGGHAIEIEGAVDRTPDREYPRLYARFADLIAAHAQDVDIAPLRLVADAFMIAERSTSAAFDW